MQYFHCDKCHYTYEAKKRDSCPECAYPNVRLATKSEKREQQKICAEILAEGDAADRHSNERLQGLNLLFEEDIEVAKFNEELYLADMYKDPYFPVFLVDKIKDLIVEVVNYLESEKHNTDDIQAKFDEMTEGINDLQEEFQEHDSEIETSARESIGQTIDEIIKHFNIDIDCETALGNREW